MKSRLFLAAPLIFLMVIGCDLISSLSQGDSPVQSPLAPDEKRVTTVIPMATQEPSTYSSDPAGPAAPPALEYRSDGALRLTVPPGGASDQNPAFSPDGQWLVFTRFENGYNRGPSALYLFRYASGEVKQLTSAPDSDNVNLPGACWDRATDRIAFSSDRQDIDEIWTVSSDGSGLTRVTTHDGEISFIEPSFSPDGRWIVFETTENREGDQGIGTIWKASVDGSKLVQLTGESEQGYDDQQPNWSPSGGWILFQRRPVGGEEWKLFMMSPDGSDLRKVAQTPSSLTDASWSPDEKWILASSDSGKSDEPKILVIPVEGGQPVQVTDAGGYQDSAPSWSPDGRWIAFESHQWEDQPASLWLIPAPKTLWPDRYPPTTPKEEPTGQSTVVDNQWWRPEPGTTWQWQLDGGEIDISFEVDMYDIDLFDSNIDIITRLHKQGRYVVCYLSAGSWEEWRPDADQFPNSVLGNDYEGWPGERWLDIRQIDLLGPVIRARLDLCRAKGFDGIEPDNIDAYNNDTGFPLTYQNQLAYNIWLANEAHARGLSIGLKNDDEQVSDLLPYFDWALTEDCFDQDWCEAMSPFIADGKAVFAAEYSDTGIQLDDFCPLAAQMGFSAILKQRDLSAWMRPCN